MPGTIINSPVMAERDGLGDVAVRWPDLRIRASGPQFSLEPDHSRVQVPFKVRWADRFQLVAELLGWGYIDATGFCRHSPESYQSWEWRFAIIGQDPNNFIPIPSMYCTKIVGMRGIGDGAQDTDRTDVLYYPEPTYEWAEVTALFETLAYDVKLKSTLVDSNQRPIEMQRWVIKKETSGGKYLQFNYGSWFIEVAPGVRQRLPGNQNYWESFKTVQYEWIDVLPGAFNRTVIDGTPGVAGTGLMGKTNDALFDIYQPETLVLIKFDPTPTKDQLGQRTYRILIEFLYVPTGVNNTRSGSPDLTTYFPIRTEDGTKKPFTPVGMAAIFRP
jgi:hypothetical protein